MKPLFDLKLEMQGLQECENCYGRGEPLFAKEHERYGEFSNRLQKEGYTLEQLIKFKEHYRSEIARIREKEKTVAGEQRIAARILAELAKNSSERVPEREQEPEKAKKRNAAKSR